MEARLVKPVKLSAADRDAMTRAIVIANEYQHKHDRLRDGETQIECKLKVDWIEAGESAAYSCQVRVLGLKPWQSPPCYGDAQPGHDGHADAAVLLKRLLDAGLSRWEPDPVAALAKIEQDGHPV
jgi:hypothetical protein